MLRHANILPNLLSFLEGDEMWSVTYPQTGAYLAYQVDYNERNAKRDFENPFR